MSFARSIRRGSTTGGAVKGKRKQTDTDLRRSFDPKEKERKYSMKRTTQEKRTPEKKTISSCFLQILSLSLDLFSSLLLILLLFLLTLLTLIVSRILLWSLKTSLLSFHSSIISLSLLKLNSHQILLLFLFSWKKKSSIHTQDSQQLHGELQRPTKI